MDKLFLTVLKSYNISHCSRLKKNNNPNYRVAHVYNMRRLKVCWTCFFNSLAVLKKVQTLPICEKILDKQRRPIWSLFKSQILSFSKAEWHEVPQACIWTPREQKHLKAFFLVAAPFSSWPSKLQVVKLAPAFFWSRLCFAAVKEELRRRESHFLPLSRVNFTFKVVDSLLRWIYLNYRK